MASRALLLESSDAASVRLFYHICKLIHLRGVWLLASITQLERNHLAVV
jgi:hypothetical protein